MSEKIWHNAPAHAHTEAYIRGRGLVLVLPLPGSAWLDISFGVPQAPLW